MTEEYTWEEIRKHNSEESAWMVFCGKVYDVTTWKEHPGGWDKIIENAGKDMSDSWSGHSDDAAAKRETILIGRVKITPQELKENEGWKVIEGQVVDAKRYMEKKGNP